MNHGVAVSTDLTIFRRWERAFPPQDSPRPWLCIALVAYAMIMPQPRIFFSRTIFEMGKEQLQKVETKIEVVLPEKQLHPSDF